MGARIVAIAAALVCVGTIGWLLVHDANAPQAAVGDTLPAPPPEPPSLSTNNNKQRWEETLAEANRGNTLAQASLCEGSMHAGTATSNWSEAARWCEAAANSGDANSQVSFAMLLRTGSGVVQNQQLALEWLEKAATQRNVEALYQLGRMLAASEDAADQARGISLLQEAAARGNGNARWELQQRDIQPEQRPEQPLIN